jgi:hypothetical protein
MNMMNVILFSLIISFSGYVSAKSSKQKNQFTWEDWCERRDTRVTREESYLVNLISIELALRGGSGTCADEKRFIERNLREIKIAGSKVNVLTPLFALRNANRLRKVDLKSTKPSQAQLYSLGFLEDLPNFIQLKLPRRTKNGKIPVCPFENSSKCI